MSGIAVPARRWPRILTRYILGDFLTHFAVSLVGIVMVMMLSTIFDSLRGLLKYDPSIFLIAAFYAARIPYNISAAVPLAALIASLLTLAKMLRSYELIAMRAGGLSPTAIAVPILAASFCISILTFAFTETVLPWSNRMAREIKFVYIRKVPLSELRMVNKAALWTSGGALVYADEANGEDGLLKGVSIFEFHGMELVGRVDADSAVQTGGMWEMKNSQAYRWNGERPRLERSSRAIYPMLERIGDFLQEDVPPDNLSMGELKVVIEKLRKAGREYGTEQVFYYFKTAFPFAAFIVTLLGLGVTFHFQTNPRSGITASFGVAFFSALFYIGLVQFGQALGVGGVIPPLIAVWMANAVFLVVGLALLWKAWKW